MNKTNKTNKKLVSIITGTVLALGVIGTASAASCNPETQFQLNIYKDAGVVDTAVVINAVGVTTMGDSESVKIGANKNGGHLCLEKGAQFNIYAQEINSKVKMRAFGNEQFEGNPLQASGTAVSIFYPSSFN